VIKVLVVEDHAEMRDVLRIQLEQNNFQVETAADIKGAEEKIQEKNFDVYLMDVKLPDGVSIALFDRYPTILASKTIIITANPSIPDVVTAIKKGAFNYLEKPIDPNLLIAQVKKVAEINRLKNGHKVLINEVASNFTFEDIIFESQQMAEVIERARVLAKTDNNILIQGETGVGKEILSQSIHNYSNRKSEIFLPVNCASIPSELFESELFGYEKGAFTGAVESYCGRFIQADKGTLFLDEIGELPLHIQAKLLRILDERTIYRLRSKRSMKIDVRLIAATNRDLLKEVKSKQFRSDLYYRLKESSITIPPLRERVEDILPTIYHFIRIYNQIYNKNVAKISKEAESHFLNHSWEGNVRELKNTVKSIIPFKHNDTIEIDDLSFTIIEGKDTRQKKILSLEEIENEHIRRVLKLMDFNITRASEVLGISRPRLYRKIKKLQLEAALEDAEAS